MSVTPDFVGQVYKDTNTGNIWRANSLTPGDWTLEVQNMGVKWTPHSDKLGELNGFVTNFGNSASLIGITSLTLNQTTASDSIWIATAEQLLSISMPNFVSFNASEQYVGYEITSCTLLQSISAPLFTGLSYSTNSFNIGGNPALTSLVLSSFVACAGSTDISYNGSLVNLSLPSFVPVNGTILSFNDNALSQASVDHVLSHCVANPAYVSGIVDLTGGTNSAPSSVGLGSDYATLVARGVTVNVNP